MSKHSIPGLGASEGQKAGSFTIFPKGEYLMKVQSITINKKEDMRTVRNSPPTKTREITLVKVLLILSLL